MKNTGASQRQIRALPLGQLQLSPYAFAAARSFATIGDLIAARERSKAFVAMKGKRGRQEIATALEQLAVATDRRGVVNWDGFRDSRPRSIRSGSPIYFFSPSLLNLHETDCRRSLGSLHLNRRTFRALYKVRVRTVGTLVKSAQEGIGFLRGGGLSVIGEVFAALTALAENVAPNGEIDWIGYARFRGFLILPSKTRTSWPPHDFVRELPRIAEAMVRSRYGRTALTIFRQRNLQSRSATSFVDIAKRLRQTKQHTNLIEKRAVRMLRRVLLNDEYHDYAFRIRPEFSAAIKLLAAKLKNSKTGIVSLTEWDRRLFETWGMHTHETGRAEHLLFKIFKLGTGAQWKVYPTLLRSPDPAVFNRALRNIESLLTRYHPRGLTAGELRIRLKQRIKKGAPTLRELDALVCCLPDIEKHKGKWRARLPALRRVVDQCERLLEDVGRPMHRKEIAVRLRERQPNDRLTIDTISSLLLHDNRFAPIGHTGVWSLARWRHVETRTIPSIAAEILERSKKPVHARKLFALISARRQVTERSLEQALYQSEQFSRTAPLTWDLTRRRKGIGTSSCES